MGPMWLSGRRLLYFPSYGVLALSCSIYFRTQWTDQTLDLVHFAHRILTWGARLDKGVSLLGLLAGVLLHAGIELFHDILFSD